MSSPKFKHDCDSCEFCGHFYGHDVYVCRDTVLARFGNEGSEYASTLIGMFRDQLKSPHHISVGGKVMLFTDYVFSEHSLSYHKAMLVALAVG